MKAYALPEGSGQDTWHDGKRHLWLLGLLVPALPFIAIGVHTLTGWTPVLWLGPFILLVLVPLLDLVAGIDPTNPPDEVMEALEEDRYYRWVTWAYLPLQYAGLAVAMWCIATQDMGLAADIGLALTVGTVAGVGINTAHELGHKREEAERWAGQDRAGAVLLRALLHRAQPRPPRPRRHAAGPGVEPDGRELLPVLAAHGVRLAAPARGGWSASGSPAVTSTRTGSGTTS